MTSWRLAHSLETLRDQINMAWPQRSRASDGTIGDAAHQRDGNASDHNPWVGPGVVTAFDITHDPAHGCDVYVLAQALAASRDSRIKYMIFTGHNGGPGILSSTVSPWRWRARQNDHASHLHLSVTTTGYDNAAPWHIFTLPHPTPGKPPYPGIVRIGSRGSAVQKVQARLVNAGYYLIIDGVFGPATQGAVMRFQRAHRLAVDGIVGPQTWAALWS